MISISVSGRSVLKAMEKRGRNPATNRETLEAEISCICSQQCCTISDVL